MKKIKKNYRVKSICNGWGTVIIVSNIPRFGKVYHVYFDNGKTNMYNKKGHVFRVRNKVSPKVESLIEFYENN